MRLFITLLALVSGFALQTFAAPKDVQTSQGYPITPVPFTAVKVVPGSFWGQRLEASRTVTIPLAFSKCESEGRYKNFERAAHPSEEYDVTRLMPYSFDDTDPYKTIEGASYILQTYPDKKLKAYIDSVLNIIAGGQEADGYLYTARTMNPKHPHEWSGPTRWSKEEDLSHELYNLGHMVESAVAHWQATGSRKFLDIAIRYADCVVREVGDKPGQACVVPGHQIAEMALCRLYLATGERKYLDEAKFLLDYRGKTSFKTEYSQSHQPVVEQDEAVGHAVRAAYMYAGMADVAALTGDKDYIQAIDRIWDNIVSRKLYITGGIGATNAGEAFGRNYELPNMTAYCETCAAIGNVYVNYRLFLLHGESKYYDVLERTLYNGLISGMSLDGGSFFYPNPLESAGQHQRRPWFGCACCPSNLCRFIPSVPGYIYAVRDHSLYVNLFMPNTSTMNVGGKRVTITQSTEYPYSGDVNIKVDKSRAGEFAIKVRIPGWAQNRPLSSDLYAYADQKQPTYSVQVNNQVIPADSSQLEQGYVVIRRNWKAGDSIALHFDMEPRVVRANDHVLEDRGRIAIERGPLVYCAEWPDNPFDLSQLQLDPSPRFTLGTQSLDDYIPEESKARLQTYTTQQLVTLSTDAKALTFDAQDNPSTQSVHLTLIPYFAWCHRGKGAMKVWLPLQKAHAIAKVEPVKVEVAVGHVPTLPWQVWVIYADGSREWRQVRWSNSSLAEEQRQADPLQTPVGTHYTVRGYILGEDNTSDGYPIEASVNVINPLPDAPCAQVKAEPLPLSEVRLIGENRLTDNRDLDVRTLLNLDITRMLYNYRDTYGLPTKGYAASIGWDSPTTKLKGHGTGHFLSALAHAYAGARPTDRVTLSNGQQVKVKDELLKRIARMVNELRACQERTFVYSDSLGRYFEARDYAPESQLQQMQGTWAAFDQYKRDYKHYGYGYLNAIPAAHPALIEYYRAYNNEDWVWAPYYTIHKQLAGLIDIATVLQDADSKLAAKALRTATDMGLWVWNRMHYRTYCQTEGSADERRSRPGNRFEMWNMYIAGEVGGMAESLSRLSEMAADPVEAERLIEAAGCFDAPAFFNPVVQNIDDIRTRHANQHIPMIVGALRSYRTNHNPYYYALACNFWNLIQGRYAYAMGGVGNSEMWRQPYTQTASMNANSTTDPKGHQVYNPDLNETCCAYNLAKLSKDLNCFDPDDARYMDYYERVLYNQIVGSVNPHEYGVCYHYAVGLNATKPFGSPTPQETCCGGTGAENHVKYQEAAYFHSDSTLYVALYLPTEARWGNVTVKQECEWPAERSALSFSGGEFALKLRVPYWATSGFEVRLNGKSIAQHYQPSSYVQIPYRQWKETDRVEVVMPFTKHIFYAPDKMDQALIDGQPTPFEPQWTGTLMLGPLVMTSPDIHTWQEATLTLSPTLSEVQITSKNPYTLQVNGKHFLPDYYVTTQPTTHYLRLNIP